MQRPERRGAFDKTPIMRTTFIGGTFVERGSSILSGSRPATIPSSCMCNYPDNTSHDNRKHLSKIGLAGRIAAGTEEPDRGHVKHSVRVMAFVTVIFVASAILPPALAQTQPAKSTPPPPATQAQPEKNTGEKAKGAAAGAAIGAATGGSAAKGAVVGAGHSRREDRRTERKNK